MAEKNEVIRVDHIAHDDEQLIQLLKRKVGMGYTWQVMILLLIYLAQRCE